MSHPSSASAGVHSGTRASIGSLAFALAALLLLPASPCPAQHTFEPQVERKLLPPGRPNILLIVADDLGVDIPGVYAEHPMAARTPRIDALAGEGLLFRNAWSNPVCSPTRATLLTGRYAASTGIGVPVDPTGSFELALNQPSIPRSLGPLYRKAVVGKWHLSTLEGTDTFHPLLMGFDHHRGPMENVPSYSMFPKSIDGLLMQNTVYATTDQANDTIRFIESFQEPWFIWLAFNASHSPLHRPPQALHTYPLPASVSEDPPLFFRAVTEAMDTEIGRVLDAIPPAVLANTYIIFVGDNGTPPHVTLPPFDPDHAKWTLYEGGVNVPLIVKGPGVAQGVECAALVHTVDLFATITDIAGVQPPSPTDSVSMAPYFATPDRPSIRRRVFAETFTPNGLAPPARDATARDVAGHKLILRYTEGPVPTAEEFYDLVADPFETTNLATGGLTEAQQLAFAELKTAITEIIDP